MRRHLLTVLTLTALLALGGSAQARPRLDRAFGAHHGYWVRTTGPWADVKRVMALPGGAVAVLGANGTLARITGGGRPDWGFGADGVVTPLELAGVLDVQMLRWGDRIVLASKSFEYWEAHQQAVVVNRRGATSQLGEVAAFPGGHPPFSITRAAVLVPFPDGTLWNVVHEKVGPGMSPSWPRSETDELMVIPPGGALGEGTYTVIDPPIGEQVSRVPPVPSGNGLILTTYDPTSFRTSLLRVTRAGTADSDFARVWLVPDEVVADLLPWDQGGVIVRTRAGRVLWIDGHGQILRQRMIPPSSSITLDSAHRLLVLHRRDDGSALILRRLRADATTDTAFGFVVLRAAGRYVTPVDVLPQPGDRILAIGRTAGHSTVAWGVRTR